MRNTKVLLHVLVFVARRTPRCDVKRLHSDPPPLLPQGSASNTPPSNTGVFDAHALGVWSRVGGQSGRCDAGGD